MTGGCRAASSPTATAYAGATLLRSTGPKIGPAARTIMTYEFAENSVSRPRSIGYVAFEEVVNRAFGDIRNGAEARPTLEQAAQQLQSTLARIQ